MDPDSSQKEGSDLKREEKSCSGVKNNKNGGGMKEEVDLYNI